MVKQEKNLLRLRVWQPTAFNDKPTAFNEACKLLCFCLLKRIELRI
jgi:hypothetical protein